MPEESFNNDRTESFVPLTKDSLVGHYRIVGKIGSGGMGEVYLAEDTELKRQVALKFLPVNMSTDEDFRERFKREAQATAKLNHPNIVHIYEVSEYNNRPFFAMEHIEGKSLYDKIKEKNISINEAIDLTGQICNGLHEAHEAGIVHRDIKPSNIILDKNGRPKILDFGLATVLDAEKLTKTGSTLGTVGYMSPEQVNGEKVDARSDLFSVGVILYEMLTGRRPFQAEYEGATLNAILHDTPEPLSRYKSGVTGELQQIVSKALEKNPETRYQTSSGMLADLKRLHLSESKKPGDWWNRYIVSSAVIVLIFVLLIIKPWKFEIGSTQNAVAQENRLAIMYFDNLADPEDPDKLGEIASNLLITDLSESKYVDVVSSQRLYDILKLIGHEGEKKIDRSVATEVAEKARCRWMLQGSILQVQPNIIITSQLVDMQTGSAIASQRVNGADNEKIFSLVDKLTVEIKNDLSLPAAALEESDPAVSTMTSSTEAYKYYLEGFELLFKYKGAEARNKFIQAIRIDSTFAMAYFGLSWSDADSELRHQAITHALKYIDKVPEIDQMGILARKAQLDGDKEKAIQILEKILKNDPENKDTWNSLGVLYKSIDKQKALECFLKSIEIDSLYKISYNELAYLYNDLGDPDRSIWAINKYIEIAPNEPNPYDTRGDLYAHNGRLEEAIASYEKALEIDPNFVLSLGKLGDMYLFNRQYDKAESLYTELASNADKYNRAKGRLFLARIPFHQGRIREGLHILEVGIEADKMEIGEGTETASKLWVRSFIYGYLLKDYDKGIDEAKKAVAIQSRISPKDKFVNMVLANIAYCYAGKGDYKMANMTAEEIKNNIESNKSSNPGIYEMARAFIAFQKGDFNSALTFWKPEIKSAIFAYDYFAAVSSYGAGNFGDAVHLLEETMKVYDLNRAYWPSLSVETHYWLGKAYEASGWNDKAIKQYEIFLDIWKNADEGLEPVEDARAQLAKLKSST